VYHTQAKGLVFKLYELIKKEKPEESTENVNKALEGYLTLLKHFISLENQ
jgi:hypothetical protein